MTAWTAFGIGEGHTLTLDEARNLLPVGTPVTYWPGIAQGDGIDSVTRTEVWRMPSGQLVAAVEGYAGGIALTHIIKRPAAGGTA